MRAFETFDQSVLMDALADYTARYTRLLTRGGKQKDIINCHETMQSLISEIELRKKTGETDPSGEKNR